MRTPVVYSRILFEHPFSLRGVADMQPAGSYSIETRNQHSWTFPFSWETRARTMIRICAKPGLDGVLHEHELDPRDLFRAMENDRLYAAH